MSAIGELRKILDEMADLEDGQNADDILFTHELCVEASAELAMCERELIIADGLIEQFYEEGPQQGDATFIAGAQASVRASLSNLKSDA